MIGDIYIIGQIGTFDGVKGFELAEFVQQYEKMKSYDRVNVHINSCGGLVSVGYAIKSYIENFSNIHTIAENECMSIATVVATSVPVEKRSVVKGCNYMVHAPWVTVGGNSEELSLASEELKDLENQLINTYVKCTTTSKAGIEAIVKQETYLTDKQVVDYGFASKIINATKSKAVAFVDKSNNNNEKSKLMTELGKKISELKNWAVKAFNVSPEELETKAVDLDNTREALAMEIVTDKGTLVTEYSDVLVGDSAMIDGVVAEDGDYVAEDGTVFTVTAGKISAIVFPDDSMAEELATLKTQLEEKETELASLKAKNSELENDNKEALALMEKLSNIKSTHKPDTRAYVPNGGKGKGTKDAPMSYAERMKARAEK